MRVLIIDDHPLYREGLKALLFGLQPDIDTVDVASVAAALALVDVVAPPDLVLLDMSLPGTSHLEALRQVRAAFDGASVVVISAEEGADFMLATIDAGAAGYIPKSTDPALTIQALRLVLAHGVYLPAAALRHLPGASVAPGSRPELSERQWAVLQRLLQGKANKVIARELEIAEGTVKAHLWAIYQALGVASRTQAMFRAHELHLFDSAEPSRH